MASENVIDARAELLRRRLDPTAGLSEAGQSEAGRSEAGRSKSGPRPLPARPERPPLSPAQRRLWFLDQLRPGDTAYVVPLAYRLTGELDRPALARAIGLVTARHETLRTRLPAHDGEPYQRVDPAGPVLELEDLSDRPDPVTAAVRAATEEAARPFDLSAGPLFRPRLLRLGPRDHVLLMTVHHAVFDGASLNVLLTELSSFYVGGPDDREALPFQYADHAAGPDDDASAGYWRARLAGCPETLEMPTGRTRPREPSSRAGEAGFEIPPATVAALPSLARQHTASTFIVSLAAFLAVLSVHTGSDDVVAGIPAAGRDRPGLRDQIGFYANTLVIRVAAGRGVTFAELVDRTRDAVLDALAHQDMRFDRLVDELAPTRTLHRNLLVQALFTMLHRESGGDAGALLLPGLETSEFVVGRPTTRFDLEMHVRDLDGAMTGRLLYAEDVFDPAVPRWFAGHYVRMLTEAVAAPERDIHAVPLLTDEEAALITSWNDSASGNDAARTA